MTPLFLCVVPPSLTDPKDAPFSAYHQRQRQRPRCFGFFFSLPTSLSTLFRFWGPSPNETRARRTAHSVTHQGKVDDEPSQMCLGPLLDSKYHEPDSLM